MTTATQPDVTTLVEEHLHLVHHVVAQVAVRYPRHVDRQELWAAGAAGLVEAARRFDPDAEVPFARYATIRIRGAIIDATRSRDWATRGLRRRARELQQATRTLEQATGRTPTTGELAASLGISEDEVHARRHAVDRATLLHLDRPTTGDAGADGETTLGAFLAEQDTTSLPDQAMEERELRGTLRVAVAHLDPTHREVVERSYMHGERLQDIATSLGVTEARVSQIRAEALDAIRAWLGTRYEGVPVVATTAPGQRRRSAYMATMAARASWSRCLDAADRQLSELCG